MSTDSMAMPIGLTIIKDLDGEPVVSGIYGKEAIFDCSGCDPKNFNRKSLTRFFDGLVKLLNMEKGDLHFWDDVGVPKAKQQNKFETIGTSAIQFILTSNITLHCLDKLYRVYINIFSYKDFEVGQAKEYIQKWFDARFVRVHIVYRN